MFSRIDRDFLEQACKEIIETILYCLPNAFKGTVYMIGSPPDATATRITSGIISRNRESISWGLPEVSEYNPPGKPWLQYRDEPGRPLEAMAWCVERQRSWTAEDPEKDNRSVKLQVEGFESDTHHMEPVLIRKEDLFTANQIEPQYPKTYHGKTLWTESDYVVAAVIKIHFQPKSIKLGGPETKVIKRLSTALGTEILSYELRQQSVEAMQDIADDRLNSCNMLADSLRNAIAKSGLLFSLTRLELAFLRAQWERFLLEGSPQKGMRREAIDALNTLITGRGMGSGELGNDLIANQERFLEFSLPPEKGMNWIRMKIEDKWDELIAGGDYSEAEKSEIRRDLDKLKDSLYIGKDPERLAVHPEIPDELKGEWVDLIYDDSERMDAEFLDRIIKVLENPNLNLPYKEKSKKSLFYLKTMLEVIGHMEQRTNEVIRGVLNGNGKNGSKAHS